MCTSIPKERKEVKYLAKVSLLIKTQALNPFKLRHPLEKHPLEHCTVGTSIKKLTTCCFTGGFQYKSDKCLLPCSFLSAKGYGVFFSTNFQMRM